jgi:hypothetical protein
MPQTGSSSSVQAIGDTGRPQRPELTTWKPSTLARQALVKVWRRLPRWAQTGACSNVQATSGRGTGLGSSTITVQAARSPAANSINVLNSATIPGFSPEVLRGGS